MFSEAREKVAEWIDPSAGDVARSQEWLCHLGESARLPGRLWGSRKAAASAAKNRGSLAFLF